MEKIYPDSDEIRLQVGTLMSYLQANENIIKKEKIGKSTKGIKDELIKLKNQRTAAEKAIDLIIESYQGIEVQSHSENETLQEIVKECPHIELQVNRQPRITCGMKSFIEWFLEKGFLSKDRNPAKNSISEEFIKNNSESKCKNIESIKKAVRTV